MTLSYEEGGECTRLTYARFVKGEGEVEDVLVPPVHAGGVPPSNPITGEGVAQSSGAEK